MATLRKMSGKWYIRSFDHGKETIFPTRTSRKSEAEKQLKEFLKNELLVKQKLKNESEIKPIRIEDAINKFNKDYTKEKQVTLSTLKSYKLALQDFSNAFKNHNYVHQITRIDYPRLVDYLKKRYNITTVNIRLRGIRVFLNWLEEIELIEKKPFKIKELKKNKKLPKYLSHDELNRFYKAIPIEKHKATFRVLEKTGMRVGELAGSKRDNKYIYIHESKSKAERIIPIKPEIYKDYDLAMNNVLEKTYLSKLFKKYANSVGIYDRSLHSLRHTAAINLIRNNKNIVYVKKILGHSSVTVTEQYLVFSEDLLKECYDS